MGWGHACWHTSTYALAIMALLSVTLVAVDYRVGAGVQKKC